MPSRKSVFYGMIANDNRSHRAILRDLARRAMTDRGLVPEFSPEVLAELETMNPALPKAGEVRDLRHLLWCSIDNNESRDLDQLTVAEAMSGNQVRIMVAIADVDALVRRESAIDRHARQNTVSVYTSAEIFPLLPEKLSTDLTSLNYHRDRLALVVDMELTGEGGIAASGVFRAYVRSRAKLNYESVGAWLEGDAPFPEEAVSVAGLEENLRLQALAAAGMKEYRHSRGALDFESRESTAVFEGDMILELKEAQRSHARDIIEEFMIGSNEITAGFLTDRNFPSFRRIVKNPKRWGRIREIAGEHDWELPEEPDPGALQRFMAAAKIADPDGFPDLSLSIIKLLGPGEYAIGYPDEPAAGHFGLAVKNYSHSTAPNRRYPDLITHRLIKAALAGEAIPYTRVELEELALHCTRKEDDAKKVERQVSKSAAALVLEHRLGQQYDGMITGSAEKGTWVRIRHPHIEGRIVEGAEGLDVGRQVRVELVGVDVEMGYIDFKVVK